MSRNYVKKETLPDVTGEGLDRLLEKLYFHANLDFRDYKLTSISRRVERRLRATGSDSYQQYSDFLDSHPDEYERLIDDLTVNVTEFFRDETPWHVLKETVFPELVSRKIAYGSQTPLRIWSAGCATGQETYSVAILLNELFNEMGISPGVEIYGTDIDFDCLNTAQEGRYRRELFTTMDSEFIDKYFDADFCIDASIKKHIRFQRHDLVLDPPLNEMDLVLCRNVAIYFSRELQERLFANFLHCLNDGGYLFLGKAESLCGDIAKKFKVVNSTWKIYQKINSNIRS